MDIVPIVHVVITKSAKEGGRSKGKGKGNNTFLYMASVVVVLL